MWVCVCARAHTERCPPPVQMVLEKAEVYKREATVYLGLEPDLKPKPDPKPKTD